MKRILLYFLVVILLCLPACGKETPMPRHVIGDLLAGMSLPSGVVYGTESMAGGQTYLSNTLLISLFGECKEQMKGVRSASVYLSAKDEICEAAVFFCYGTDGCERVAELCQGRAEILKKNIPNTAYKIVVSGRYVLFTAGEKAEEMMSLLKRGVR